VALQATLKCDAKDKYETHSFLVMIDEELWAFGDPKTRKVDGSIFSDVVLEPQRIVLTNDFGKVTTIDRTTLKIDLPSPDGMIAGTCERTTFIALRKL
jgi:hypothetical protein